MSMEQCLLTGLLCEPRKPEINLWLQADMNRQKVSWACIHYLTLNAVFVFRSDSRSVTRTVYCNFFLQHLHQRDILKALLLLKDPAEGGTRDNRGDPVRKWLFKSVHQLTCQPNEESCCYWWQQNYFGVISGRDIRRSKLIDQKHLIYAELTLATCRSRARRSKKIR